MLETYMCASDIKINVCKLSEDICVQILEKYMCTNDKNVHVCK